CRTSKRFVLFWESKVIAQASFAEGVRRRLLPRRTAQRLLSMLSERNSCMAPHPGLTSDARRFLRYILKKALASEGASWNDIYSRCVLCFCHSERMLTRALRVSRREESLPSSMHARLSSV